MKVYDTWFGKGKGETVFLAKNSGFWEKFSERNTLVHKGF